MKNTLSKLCILSTLGLSVTACDLEPHWRHRSDGTTRDYVMSVVQLATPITSDTSRINGFDLDSLASTDGSPHGCGHADMFDARVPNEFGIDNQLGIAGSTIAGFDHDGESATRIADGTFLAGIRLSEVHSFVNDDFVEIEGYYLSLAETGGSPDLGDEGLIAAGQSYDVREESFDSAGVVFAKAEGEIVDGRFRLFSGQDFNIPISLTSSGVFPISKGQVEFDVTETELTDGVVGAALDVQGAAAVLANEDSIGPATAETLLYTLADLDRDEAGVCQSVSVAVEFSGVSAVITDAVVSGS